MNKVVGTSKVVGMSKVGAFALVAMLASLADTASAQLTVPAAFTVDYEELATTGMTAAGTAIAAGVVVLGAIWAINFGLKVFKRLAK